MVINVGDREAVRNLVARQKFAVDDCDAAALAVVWAKQGAVMSLTFNGGDAINVAGHDAIIAFVAKGWSQSKAAPHVHIIGTLELWDEPDGRIGTDSYCLYLEFEHQRVAGYGRYRDIFALEDDGWKLQQRTVNILADFTQRAAS